jgi:hypothetical protein
MLLTKRLTTFLSQNTSPQLPTLLLISPTGKLLSSSSPLPASTLRTQATLACSLWNLYQPSAPSLITSALPRTAQQSDARNHPRLSESTTSSTTTAAESELSIMTIQLSHGIMVIRALACGLLFVAIGPSSSGSSAQLSPHLLQGHHASLESQTSPSSSPPTRSEDTAREREISGGSFQAMGVTTPSEAGSVGSSGTRTGSIMGMRRQAEEVAKWLDGQLEGFALGSGEVR